MIQFIMVCGIFGLLILLLTGALLVAAILVAFLAKRRKARGVLALMALLPLGLGLLGTAAGYSKIARQRAMYESPDRALIEHSQSQARYPAYLGQVAPCCFGWSADLERRPSESRSSQDVDRTSRGNQGLVSWMSSRYQPA